MQLIHRYQCCACEASVERSVFTNPLQPMTLTAIPKGWSILMSMGGAWYPLICDKHKLVVTTATGFQVLLEGKGGQDDDTAPACH